jgi:hypothetical protein
MAFQVANEHVWGRQFYGTLIAVLTLVERRTTRIT